MTPDPSTVVLALAERYDWPRVQLAPAISVGPGRAAWHHFAALATGIRVEQAHAALVTLPDNPSEPINPRLV